MSDSYKQLITACITLIIGIIVTLITRRVTIKVLGNLAKRTKSQTDDYIANTIIEAIKPLGLIISLIMAMGFITLSKQVEYFFLVITQLLLLLFLIRSINKIVISIVYSWAYRVDDRAISTMIRSLCPMIRAIIWCIGVVIYLQNIGVQMAAIWALLSAGGIGAGLALKEPVQEFFEYITILLDKPFQDGQFIHIDNVWATVERVGVRSTRLRSVNGEVIVMSNSALTNGVISNYAEMRTRRLVHKIGVVYDTSLNNLKLIPTIMKEIIDSIDNAEYDRCHFVEFGSSSLDFELVYYVPTNNYLLAMEVQQKINLEIVRKFTNQNIEFAFPTQTLNVLNK